MPTMQAQKGNTKRYEDWLRQQLGRDLSRRKRGWLAASARKMAAAVDREHNEWKVGGS